MKVLGVTLDWGLKPTRMFQFADGFVGIVYGDRRISPEAYDADGWPVDLETGSRLSIYVSPRPPSSNLAG